MSAKKVIPLLLTSLFAVVPAAHASIDLIAIGNLSSFADLSTQTAGALENGVAGNLLGGIGSGLAYAGGNTFIALPDRGPNATSYNSAVDDTTSYITRFQTLSLNLTASAPGSALPYTLTPTLTATTLLSSATPLAYGSGAGLNIGSGVPALNATNNTYYFTGRSDNFDPTKPSTNANNARLDPEGVRVANDGKSVFVSDEYGPYVHQFDRATGQRIRTFDLPGNLAVANLSPQGAVEISNNTAGRLANKGMEGLAITPDGKTLVGIMQSPLIQDGGKNALSNRIVTIDIASGTTHEYVYKLDSNSNTVSEIVAINATQFLVDERDGKGLGDNSTAAVKKLYKIDISGAADVSNLAGAGNLDSNAVGKTLFLDVKTALNNAGINSKDIPAKLEGVSFGQDIVIGGVTKHTLYVANDNDFLSTVTDSNHPAGIANPNKFFVFAVDSTDVQGFEAQQIAAVPEPSTYATMLAGLLVVGGVIRRRRG